MGSDFRPLSPKPETSYLRRCCSSPSAGQPRGAEVPRPIGSPDDLQQHSSKGGRTPGSLLPAAGSEGGLVLEIELWRSDLMTGLFHIDKFGRIVRTSEIPLFQPGRCIIPDLQIGVEDWT